MSDSLFEWKKKLRALQRQVDLCRGLLPRGVTRLSPEHVAVLHQNARNAEDALRVHYDKLKRH